MNLDWGPDARARIAVDPKGGLIVTFGTFQDKNFNGRAYFARSTDNGASFTRPRPITADTTSQRFEIAGVDPAGRVFATWLDKRNVAKARAAGRRLSGRGARLCLGGRRGGLRQHRHRPRQYLRMLPAGAGLRRSRPAGRGVPQHLPGLGARPCGHHLPGRQDAGTGATRERRRLEDRSLSASRTQSRHCRRRLLSRRLVHRRRGAQGPVLRPRRFRRRPFHRAPRLVIAGSSAGAAVPARRRPRAASRVEGVRRHEGAGALAGLARQRPPLERGAHRCRHRRCLRPSAARRPRRARLPVVADQGPKATA